MNATLVLWMIEHSEQSAKETIFFWPNSLLNWNFVFDILDQFQLALKDENVGSWTREYVGDPIEEEASPIG